jgi:hypothetical protein
MLGTKATRTNIQKILALLEEFPQRIASLTVNLDNERLHTPLVEEEWSLVEILAHLRCCEEVWANTIYTMLALDDPELAEVHPRQWAKVVKYDRLDFRISFRVFHLRRRELLEVLLGLPVEAWLRTGVIKGRQHSVYSQARRLALHEADHLEQIEALIPGEP